jgi:phosphatidylglycerophosphatase A
MNFRSKLIVGAATGGFIGLIPFAPGTFGSILGLLFYFFMSGLHLLPAFFLMIFFIIIAVRVSGAAEKILEKKDPGSIVIDEIAGMAVTFYALPLNLMIGITGFIVFRFFDILKPFPIKYLESKFKGGVGIVIDDVVAGIMGNIVLHIIVYLAKAFGFLSLS